MRRLYGRVKAFVLSLVAKLRGPEPFPYPCPVTVKYPSTPLEAMDRARSLFDMEMRQLGKLVMLVRIYNDEIGGHIYLRVGNPQFVFRDNDKGKIIFCAPDFTAKCRLKVHSVVIVDADNKIMVGPKQMSLSMEKGDTLKTDHALSADVSDFGNK